MWSKEIRDRREFEMSRLERVNEEVLSFAKSLQYEQIREIEEREFLDDLRSDRKDDKRIALTD